MLQASEQCLLNIPREVKRCSKFSTKFNENTHEKDNELTSLLLEELFVEIKAWNAALM
jgi:hypothetical protein